MYIDPNTGGMLAGVLGGILTAITGLFLVFSGKIRAYFAQLQRKRREAKGEKEQQG